jgi:hypothetical protein
LFDTRSQEEIDADNAKSATPPPETPPATPES